MNTREALTKAFVNARPFDGFKGIKGLEHVTLAFIVDNSDENGAILQDMHREYPDVAGITDPDEKTILVYSHQPELVTI